MKVSIIKWMSIVLVLTGFSTVFAEDNNSNFNEFYNFFTEYLLCDNRKEYDNTVTRDECVAYVSRAVGIDSTLFFDYYLESLSWWNPYVIADYDETAYTGYVIFAVKNGIIAGTGVKDNYGMKNLPIFEPKREATYAEAVAFATRAAVTTDLNMNLDDEWDFAEKNGLINKNDEFYSKKNEKIIYGDLCTIVERILPHTFNFNFERDLGEDMYIMPDNCYSMSNIEFIQSQFQLDNWIDINDEPWKTLYSCDSYFQGMVNKLR